MTADHRQAIAENLHELRRAIWREAMLGAVRRFNDFDFSLMHLAALLLLEEAGAPTIKQISAELGRSLSATSRLLDQLVQRGLVQRREDERDRRARRVTLTDDGRAFLSALERQRADAQVTVMRYLSAAERARVLDAMALLAEASRRSRHDDRPGADPPDHDNPGE